MSGRRYAGDVSGHGIVQDGRCPEEECVSPWQTQLCLMSQCIVVISARPWALCGQRMQGVLQLLSWMHVSREV